MSGSYRAFAPSLIRNPLSYFDALPSQQVCCIPSFSAELWVLWNPKMLTVSCWIRRM